MTNTPTLSHLRPELDRGLDQLGLALPDPVHHALLAYLALLARWNRTYNLSAVRDPDQMLVRHLFDSLAVAAHVHGRRLADIGTGPGLPGIPLALAMPELQVLLVDSNGKKARFLREAVRTLGLGERCQVSQARVEALADSAGYDTVTSRAFASLADFIAGSRDLLAPGGRWLALKGQRPDDEIDALPADIRVEAIVPLAVPGLAAQRHAVIMSRSGQPGPGTPTGTA
ncbi:MAG: 16S rRNA (guanine(527)-N(7))-methyltransferase RsmG [Xanthomonadales bacterium]|nr:16S rRNA (guanine(527)-N(7))-methyltransferase RsmG [Xanthomonadales bacterium]